MYSYNYNIPRFQTNMYRSSNNNDQRFVGWVAPLLLGGVAGYAIGANNTPNYYYPAPYYYPNYSNNYYYQLYYY